MDDSISEYYRIWITSDWLTDISIQPERPYKLRPRQMGVPSPRDHICLSKDSEGLNRSEGAGVAGLCLPQTLAAIRHFDKPYLPQPSFLNTNPGWGRGALCSLILASSSRLEKCLRLRTHLKTILELG